MRLARRSGKDDFHRRLERRLQTHDRLDPPPRRSEGLPRIAKLRLQHDEIALAKASAPLEGGATGGGD